MEDPGPATWVFLGICGLAYMIGMTWILSELLIPEVKPHWRLQARKNRALFLVYVAGCFLSAPFALGIAFLAPRCFRSKKEEEETQQPRAACAVDKDIPPPPYVYLPPESQVLSPPTGAHLHRSHSI
ncbi:hypothetical protein QBC39DRAFT_330393 [Podospora conica]|nr:hypothetical protein QBC39DRAFT_330393 [Schizothecium conicum]